MAADFALDFSKALWILLCDAMRAVRPCTYGRNCSLKDGARIARSTTSCTAGEEECARVEAGDKPLGGGIRVSKRSPARGLSAML